MYLAATKALQGAGSDPSIGAILFAGTGGVFTAGAAYGGLEWPGTKGVVYRGAVSPRAPTSVSEGPAGVAAQGPVAPDGAR